MADRGTRARSEDLRTKPGRNHQVPGVHRAWEVPVVVEADGQGAADAGGN
jgi:hypothetical protein